jgi:hypothetical protein
MLDFFGARMQAISLHVVGNKQRGEGVRLSKGTLDMDSEDTRDTLKNYFLKSFTSAELFRFTHASSLDLNEVYSYARDIFQGKGSFEESAVFIARHLYECSIHPKIQSGELFVVHFHDCVLEGKGMQALGIFKSELKEKFIRTDIQNGSAIAGVFDGIDTKKLDRGCLILDTRDAEGYVVAHVDQLNKGNDTQFWMYDFLNIEPLQNDYHQTKQFLNLCQNFIVQELPEKLETDKTAQIKMLQRSVDYFRNNESMELEQFVAEVFEEPKVIEEFKQFKTTYQEEREMPVYDSFDISNAAVKKQAKIFKSVIKLDKNFHIYVHGNNQWLERGFDEQRGMKYYKVFYQEEQ